LRVDNTSEERLSKDSNHRAHTDANESQARYAGIPATMLRENNRVSHEAEIKNGINQRNPGFRSVNVSSMGELKETENSTKLTKYP